MKLCSPSPRMTIQATVAIFCFAFVFGGGGGGGRVVFIRRVASVNFLKEALEMPVSADVGRVPTMVDVDDDSGLVVVSGDGVVGAVEMVVDVVVADAGLKMSTVDDSAASASFRTQRG